MARAAITLGDSITDGRGSTTNGNDRWPNLLARRLYRHRNRADIAVLNQGIGGNRVLVDGLGPSALSRFERDVLALANVRWLIIFEGINDIGVDGTERATGAPPNTAEAVIKAYDQMIQRAHARSILVFGGTLTPFEGSFYFDSIGEAERQRINEFIRHSGRFDAVIDFDEAMRDPLHPVRLAPELDSGDHLHPSAKGHRILANAVNLALFGD